MEYNNSGLIPLFNLEEKEFHNTITKLDGYWKAQSIAYLDKFGLPTLRSIAITNWNDETKKNLVNYCKEHNWESVVIRTDKKHETGRNIPRGGYLVSLEQLDTEIQRHIQNGRIVMILEPRDKFRNLYGINVQYDNPNTIYFEIVGPGFDVSNLNRGDITPHERFTVNLQGEELEIKNHDIISQLEYEKSVNYRYKQIGESLLEENRDYSEKEKIQSGKNHLKTHGYFLLGNAKNYQPLLIDEIKKIRNSISKLPNLMLKMGLDNDDFVVSATIFDSGELIFWDIVWPKSKFEGVMYG